MQVIINLEDKTNQNCVYILSAVKTCNEFENQSL